MISSRLIAAAMALRRLASSKGALSLLKNRMTASTLGTSATVTLLLSWRLATSAELTSQTKSTSPAFRAMVRDVPSGTMLKMTVGILAA